MQFGGPFQFAHVIDGRAVFLSSSTYDRSFKLWMVFILEHVFISSASYIVQVLAAWVLLARNSDLRRINTWYSCAPPPDLRPYHAPMAKSEVLPRVTYYSYAVLLIVFRMPLPTAATNPAIAAVQTSVPRKTPCLLPWTLQLRSCAARVHTG